MNQRKVIPPVSPYRQKLHRIFVDALGDAISESRDMEHRPFFVTLHRPIPISLEIYMFPALNPPGGRNAHEYKINILLQGHKQGTRMSFPDNENYPILIAYAESFDVFIIFDAYAHRNFTPNTNVQFRDDVIFSALIHGISYMTKANGEHVIAAKSDKLLDAIMYRILDKLPEHEVVI